MRLLVGYTFTIAFAIECKYFLTSGICVALFLLVIYDYKIAKRLRFPGNAVSCIVFWLIQFESSSHLSIQV